VKLYNIVALCVSIKWITENYAVEEREKILLQFCIHKPAIGHGNYWGRDVKELSYRIIIERYAFIKCMTEERVMPFARRNEADTQQFQNSFETVLFQFCFSFISLCGRHNRVHRSVPSLES